MKLTEEQKNNIVSTLNNASGGTGITCVICKNTQWILSDKTFEVREFKARAICT